MAGRIDQVEDIFFTAADIFHLDGMALDGNTFFFLQIHGVEHLVFHFPLVERMRALEHAVGEGALAVVNVGDDAEVADILHGAAKIDKKSGFSAASVIPGLTGNLISCPCLPSGPGPGEDAGRFRCACAGC